MLTFVISIICLFLIELLYFKIADRYNIIDKPNQRSSHSQITLRGGGIIFPLAIITALLNYQATQWYLTLAVCAIALISFLDDIITLNNKIRISIHFLAVLLVIYQIMFNQDISSSFLSEPQTFISILLAFIIIIGIINAYNFMDGINGITVIYSIVAVGSFYLIQEVKDIAILDTQIIVVTGASLLVFGYFNLRKKAKAFAGDVGSISMALFICFFIAQLIYLTQDFRWILLLGIYGLDAVATIFCRVLRKENIFEAHRSHFYQFLANEKKISHVFIAFVYGLVQLALNLVILYANAILIYGLFVVIILTYILIRLKLEGKERLFRNYA
ncbi:glycosyl transferase family 4 [Pedobacter aquae]|uniref:Glycosyl transferase family 4 n=1 Tax=Pedobacter aquae TaxID=2605747 RepID=A0A5C0VJD7_9SPHI|nr:glycosyl transferase family 4 [Pedobacter aquae]QEK52197.1 glycosyl transferase family 4 [Pedobacter aquae]